MSRVCIFLADGFEETEAITTVDILRRGRVSVTMVSISDSLHVRGRNHIEVAADVMWKEADSEIESADMLILPGGQPGVTYLARHKGLKKALEKAAKDGKKLAAICAGPVVLGQLGLLEGKEATCYPGLESDLTGAKLNPEDEVVTDGNVTTSRGVGTACAFALKLVEILEGKSVRDEVRREIVYKRK